jgi:ABC-type amino acid transport substrate-binding protein/ABC-type Na+ efflux pump permease subunit/membrane protease YdiL (CAAX protease family)
MSDHCDGGDSAQLRRRQAAGARLALARRDLLEFVRDRRTLFVTLLLPMAMYPVLALSSALGVRTAISDLDAKQAPAPMAVAFSGSPRDAQALASRWSGLATTVEGVPRRGWPSTVSFGYATPEEAREAVESGQVAVWIEVPERVLNSLDGTGTLELEVHGPQGRVLSQRERGQVDAMLATLAEDARRRRVAAADLPASLLEPVRQRYDGKADDAAAIRTRSILPTAAGGVFVLLAVLTMTGAFYPAIDAIAGEKERGTIETLLIAPCAPLDIVAGKFLAVWAVALAGLVANVISIALTAVVTLRFLPQGGPLLPAGHLPVIVLVSVAAFVGLSAVAAAMCLAVTTASKSGKEAQNTLTPVLLFASALAGAGLLADIQSNPLLPAVPFAGQVAVAKATLEFDRGPPASGPAADGLAAGAFDGLDALGRVAIPLAMSLVASAVVVWLLLRGTAVLLTDEEILFRGPDVAGNVLARPLRRRRPTVAQGLSALAIGLTGLWYAQGIPAEDFAWAIPLQQAAAVGLPLLLLLAWQRVDLRRTFAIGRPGGPDAAAWQTGFCLVGAGLLGAGLFMLGAAALLAIRGTNVTDEARRLAEKLVTVMREKPWWLSWGLIALLPAVAEELLFRGWVQSAVVGAWPSRARAVTGVVVQAACFAIFHLLPERMPQTFLLGLMTGAITLATRSIFPAMVCHMAHNSMPLVLLWLSGGLSGATAPDLAQAVEGGGQLPGWAVAAGAVAALVGGGMLRLAAGPPVSGRGRLRAAAAIVSLAILPGLLPPAIAGAAEPPVAVAAGVPGRVRAAVMPIDSAVEWHGEQPTGVMVDIWSDLARRLGCETEFVRVDAFARLMEAAADGTVDVALGPIAITEERERIIDFTHPVAHSGLRLAVRHREESGFIPALESLISWRLLELLGAVLALALLSGHLLWWFERGHNPESFPPQYPRGVWEAIWWIASTIVAGGCDNKHVASVLGRAIAFAWMVGGIVLLAAFTSVLTATITAERVNGSIHGPKDLPGRTVGCQESAVSVKAVRQRGGLVQEFTTMREALDALSLGMVDVVCGENQQLMQLLSDPAFRQLRLVGPMFESFDYGLGLPSGSRLREPLNTAILRMREDGTLDRIREQWLGRHD